MALGEGYRTVDSRWTLRCAEWPGHGHEILLNARLGYAGRTLAEYAMDALPHCTAGTGWDAADGSERPGAAQWESWVLTAKAVLDRAVRQGWPADPWVQVTDDEWTTLVAVIGDAADYMVTNDYGTDGDFPADAAAAQAFTDVYGSAHLVGLEACRSVWVGGPS